MVAPMKNPNEKAKGTSERLDRVAQNLYRDRVTSTYYGMKKVSGRRKLHSLETTDRVTAAGKLARWLGELADADASASDLKLAALVNKYKAVRAGQAVSTVRNDTVFADRFVATFERGMGVKVVDIRTSDLSAWITGEATKSGWEPRTFNHYRLFLKGIFDLAVQDRVIVKAQNPFDPQFIKRRKPGHVFRRIPTLEQFTAIVAYARREPGDPKAKGSDPGGSRHASQFIELLGGAGVGQAEAASMVVRDLGVTGPDERLVFIRQKTKKRFQVPVYPWLRNLVAELRDDHKLSTPETPVFTIKDVKTPMATACRNLKFPRFTQRNLRAMLIKRLHDLRITPKQIAAWQGHTDGGVLIQQVYTEVFCDSDRTAERANLALLEEKVVPFETVAA